jgi:hypothetical protein
LRIESAGGLPASRCFGFRFSDEIEEIRGEFKREAAPDPAR